MDANATTPLLPEVFDAMRPFWIEHFGNAELYPPAGPACTRRRSTTPGTPLPQAAELPRGGDCVYFGRNRGRQSRSLFGVMQPYPSFWLKVVARI